MLFAEPCSMPTAQALQKSMLELTLYRLGFLWSLIACANEEARVILITPFSLNLFCSSLA
jgi:hypothetical protein